MEPSSFNKRRETRETRDVAFASTGQVELIYVLYNSRSHANIYTANSNKVFGNSSQNKVEFLTGKIHRVHENQPEEQKDLAGSRKCKDKSSLQK